MLAAQADLHPAPAGSLDDLPDQGVDRRVAGIVEWRHGRIVAARRHHVLDQVVAADRVEVGGEGRRGERRRRDLDHHAERRHGRLDARRTQIRHDLLEHGARCFQLVRQGHHRQHDLEIARGGGAGERAQLHPENLGPRQRQAKAAQAEEGVALAIDREARDRLVAAGIERAHDHRPARGPLDDPAVDLVLLLLVRQLPALEQELGAGQADAVAMRRIETLQQGRVVDIDGDMDPLAVRGHGGRGEESRRRPAPCRRARQGAFGHRPAYPGSGRG